MSVLLLTLCSPTSARSQSPQPAWRRLRIVRPRLCRRTPLSCREPCTRAGNNRSIFLRYFHAILIRKLSTGFPQMFFAVDEAAKATSFRPSTIKCQRKIRQNLILAYRLGDSCRRCSWPSAQHSPGILVGQLGDFGAFRFAQQTGIRGKQGRCRFVWNGPRPTSAAAPETLVSSEAWGWLRFFRPAPEPVRRQELPRPRGRGQGWGRPKGSPQASAPFHTKRPKPGNLAGLRRHRRRHRPMNRAPTGGWSAFAKRACRPSLVAR